MAIAGLPKGKVPGGFAHHFDVATYHEGKGF